MDQQDLHTATLHCFLDRMRHGDSEARNELLRRIAHRLERLCRKMFGAYPSLRKLEETGDIYQNAVLRLMNSLDDLRPATTREFFALAAEHVRRELLDLTKYHQRNCRRPNGARLVSIDAAESRTPHEPADLRDSPEELERWQNLHEAVLQLPTTAREAFMLIFYSGWALRDVACLFEIGERQARRHWQTACLKLKELLGDEVPQF